MPLAGLGSRFIAMLIDTLILGAAFALLISLAALVIPALGLFGPKSASWGIGAFFLILFLLVWGYFSLFEAFWSGRTPGKAAAKIRVIHQSGRGIGFVESLARNLVRVIDYMPSFYAVGIVAVFASKRNQRLGDMVAGTLVVRDRPAEQLNWSASTSRAFTGPALTASSPIPRGSPQTDLGLWGGPPGSPQSRGPQEQAFASWGGQTGLGLWGGPPHLGVVLPAPLLAKLSVSDLEVLEGFFARRLDMDLATRAALAGRIASALSAKSGLELPPGVTVETFLEAAAHQLRELGRMRSRQ